MNRYHKIKLLPNVGIVLAIILSLQLFLPIPATSFSLDSNLTLNGLNDLVSPELPLLAEDSDDKGLKAAQKNFDYLLFSDPEVITCKIIPLTNLAKETLSPRAPPIS